MSPSFLPTIIPNTPVAIIPETDPANITKGYTASIDKVIAVNCVLSPNSPIKKANATVITAPNLDFSASSSSSSSSDFKVHRENPTKAKPATICIVFIGIKLEI
ncbi:hypothetical protein D3C76_884920 [compost metagenome]